MTEYPTSAKELVHLSFCYSRLAHAIRTPLSVSISVLEDLANGYQISSSDLNDARDSLTSVTETLNHLRELARIPAFSPRSYLASELAQLFEDHIPINSLDSVAQLSLHTSPLLLDPDLLATLLRTLAQWASSRRAKNAAVEISWKLNCMNQAQIYLSLTNDSLAGLLRNAQSTDLAALSALDHSANSINLLYAHLICILHHWRTRVVAEGQVLTISISLSEEIDE